MIPFSITWPAASTTYFGSNLAITQGVSLALPGCTPVLYPSSKTAGTPLADAQMPTGNVRQLTLTSASNLSAITFAVTGKAYGQIITENITGPNATTANSVNNYSTILSVIPSATSVNTVSVGIGSQGETLFYQTDTWNKAAAYTIAYTAVDGTVSLKPQYMVDNYFNIVNGQTVFSTPNRFNLPVENANVVCSPYGTTTPVDDVASFSSISIPMAMLGTNVAAGTTGSFTQTIIQQGGRF